MTRRALVTAATLVAVLLTAAPARADWVWPVRGEVITPYRNGDDPYASGQHRGIDIAADVGTPVVAAAAGEIRFAGPAGASGLTVSVRIDDGRYDTSYLHLSSTAVRKGERVAAGDRLGAVGTTGVRSAEQPHLHFGVRDAGSRHAYHDPLALLPPAAAPERPRETPSPSPAPVPVTPAPAPEPIRIPAPGGAPGRLPAPSRVPHATPMPRRAPVSRGAPVPQGAPAPHSVPAPRTAPAPRGALAPHPTTAPRGAPAPRSAPRPLRAPHSIQGPLPAPHDAPRPLTAAESGSTPGGVPQRRAASHGPDAGWVLACLGLLAASALLGLSEDGRTATRTVTRRGRRRISALLRPRFDGR
jgi:hypothetical protein